MKWGKTVIIRVMKRQVGISLHPPQKNHQTKKKKSTPGPFGSNNDLHVAGDLKKGERSLGNPILQRGKKMHREADSKIKGDLKVNGRRAGNKGCLAGSERKKVGENRLRGGSRHRIERGRLKRFVTKVLCVGRRTFGVYGVFKGSLPSGKGARKGGLRRDRTDTCLVSGRT